MGLTTTGLCPGVLHQEELRTRVFHPGVLSPVILRPGVVSRGLSLAVLRPVVLHSAVFHPGV